MADLPDSRERASKSITHFVRRAYHVLGTYETAMTEHAPLISDAQAAITQPQRIEAQYDRP